MNLLCDLHSHPKTNLHVRHFSVELVWFSRRARHQLLCIVVCVIGVSGCGKDTTAKRIDFEDRMVDSGNEGHAEDGPDPGLDPAQEIAAEARRLETGDGVSRDVPGATRLYRQAIDLGNVEAMLDLAYLMESGDQMTPDYEAAFALYKKAAAHGSPEAYTDLGRMYDLGLGCSQDPESAFRCVSKSAELGSPRGIHDLAGFYRYGYQVKQDRQEAFRLYLKSAELDYPDAMHAVAVCFAEGVGTPQDARRAMHFLRKAADKGVEQSMYVLGKVYFDGELGEPKDRVKAVDYWGRAALQGHARAACKLGDLYEKCNRSLHAEVWYWTAVEAARKQRDQETEQIATQALVRIHQAAPLQPQYYSTTDTVSEIRSNLQGKDEFYLQRRYDELRSRRDSSYVGTTGHFTD